MSLKAQKVIGHLLLFSDFIDLYIDFMQWFYYGEGVSYD